MFGQWEEQDGLKTYLKEQRAKNKDNSIRGILGSLAPIAWIIAVPVALLLFVGIAMSLGAG